MILQDIDAFEVMGQRYNNLDTTVKQQVVDREGGNRKHEIPALESFSVHVVKRMVCQE